MLENLEKKFEQLYGGDGEIHTYISPGRVNLIGEHTDYNGGHVFPCALTLSTWGVARAREDKVLNFYSENFASKGVITASVDDLAPESASSWTAYPKGFLWALRAQGYTLPFGLDLVLGGDIPAGSGLSSSASLEVLMGVIAKDMYGFDDLSMPDIALLGQKAEHGYIGCNCGIMDQFACAMGKKDCAIFLNTDTLAYEYAPLTLSGSKIVLTNSKVKHKLVNSAYNDRRRECEEALKSLQKELDIRTLCEATPAQFEAHKSAISDPVQRKRARHVIYEEARTLQAVEALKNKDLATFGRLMNESHESLKNDYEVSCPEIDLLVDLAQQMDGVLGSRMTGGGFGGCTVSIVKEDAIGSFIDTIQSAYQKEVGHPAEFYVAQASDGAHKLS